ncbi:DUF4160 domain-containing protein [Tepidimonas aquatica]|uniref:Transcriptional regulator n=1 Tax=Tepidimonas aquatica TaxID=247482 RepID=A0A554WWI3_9BURK|nr:DUF4160 domain-containing protein [Tepidimonas aquatica]TSE27929.1 hypothetical protein Taqua_00125 [Tepidimonas aquatica]
MPTICAFYGLLIRMYWDDHEPAHFHVTYGEYSAVYAIETLTMLRGALPRRAHAMVLEWAAAHRDELMEDWQRCQQRQPLLPIAPLD